MLKYVVTVGYNMGENSNGYFVVDATSKSDAYDIVESNLGRNYSFIYDYNEYMNMKADNSFIINERYLGVLKLVRPIDEGVKVPNGQKVINE